MFWVCFSESIGIWSTFGLLRFTLCFSVRCVVSLLVGSSRSLLFCLDFLLVFFSVSLSAFFCRNCDFPLQHVPIAFCNANFGGFASKCETKRWLKKRKLRCGIEACVAPQSDASLTAVLVHWHCIVACRDMFSASLHVFASPTRMAR